MISAIRGEVLSAATGWVVLDVGGVGFRVEVVGRMRLAQPGETLALHTHLVVREDALTLFGFETQEELEVFALLLGVSGVGPRSALGVLTELTPSQVATAASREDDAPFRKVSGIGPKTAKLIAVQLHGKLQHMAFGAGDTASGVASESQARESAGVGGVSARAVASVELGLMGLGYTQQQVTEAVRDAVDAGAPTDEAGLLKAALLLLQAPRVSRASSALRSSE